MCAFARRLLSATLRASTRMAPTRRSLVLCHRIMRRLGNIESVEVRVYLSSQAGDEGAAGCGNERLREEADACDAARLDDNYADKALTRVVTRVSSIVLNARPMPAEWSCVFLPTSNNQAVDDDVAGCGNVCLREEGGSSDAALLHEDLADKAPTRVVSFALSDPSSHARVSWQQ